MYSLSTHYGDGEVGEVFESTKHFWTFRDKQFAAKCNRIEVTGDQFFKCKKQT